MASVFELCFGRCSTRKLGGGCSRQTARGEHVAGVQASARSWSVLKKDGEAVRGRGLGWGGLYWPHMVFGSGGWGEGTFARHAGSAVLPLAGTARIDRADKMPIYAEYGVSFLWLVDPALHTLEAFVLRDGHWSLEHVYQENDEVRAIPFDAVAFSLADLWS